MFPLNIPANWNNNDYLNLPLDDFEKVIDNAINQDIVLHGMEMRMKPDSIIQKD